MPIIAQLQYDSLQRVYEKQQFYPNGKLEVALLANVTKYFGEYTDQHIGFSGGIMTRYMLPFLPEIGLGARIGSGWINYERRYKARFGPDFQRQFPEKDFPNAMNSSIMRNSWFTGFEPAFYLNIFPRSSVNYYIFVGYSVILYGAQDIEDDPINNSGNRVHYPDYRDANTVDYHWIGGIGFDVFLSRRLAIGAQTSFRHIQTDLLDGYGQIDGFGRPTNPDKIVETGIKLSYYIFEQADTDGDGISDDDEIKFGTNPYKADTDGDGISDYDEISLYKSNPLKTDTDGDGMSDYDEIIVYHTNPSLTDTDGDGISDIDESLIYKTNPRLADSDGDGIADKEEIQRGANPMNADTDGDDVPDGQDICPLIAGIPTYNGCPPPPPKNDTTIILIRDTLREFHRDTFFVYQNNPSLPKNEITIPRGQSFTVYGIKFKSGSSVIEPDSYPILDTVALWLHQNSKIITEVRGHTDSVGNAVSNMALSNNRAVSVIDYLVGKGIDRSRLSPAGFGESMPIGDNGTPEGRMLNRRIEFYVKNK